MPRVLPKQKNEAQLQKANAVTGQSPRDKKNRENMGGGGQQKRRARGPTTKRDAAQQRAKRSTGQLTAGFGVHLFDRA
jgi:hypothetical protein